MNADDLLLEPGTLLHQRFRIQGVLGRGGFGAAYLAIDESRGDECVVKELLPSGSRRDGQGVVHLPNEDAAATARLRQRFIEEAKIAGKLRSGGVLAVRSVFSECGTAYFATDFLQDSQTLGQLIAARGKLDPPLVEQLAERLLQALAEVHEQGFLHRDIKPSNILLSKDLKPYLIDFGAAREWHADSLQQHTVIFTPGYAPPEQLSEKARRGPPTDLYSLGATLYHAVTGSPPHSAGDRAAGAAYVPVRQLRPEASRQLAALIDYCLEWVYAQRPPNAAAALRVLNGESADDQADDALAVFDDKAKRLREFRFQRFECPACGGVLESPKPMRRGQCPVCRQGAIVVRKIMDQLCPECRQAPLKKRSNENPLLICPICAEGFLARRKKGLLSKEYTRICDACESEFDETPQGLTLKKSMGEDLDESRRRTLTEGEWREESGRTSSFWHCGGCNAQFDDLPDGRRRRVWPKKTSRYETLYPDEWARVAAGLPPNAGNAECDHCGADYFVDGEFATLLQAELDPFHFAEDHVGRLLSLEDMRWLGVGKESPAPGLVCADCGTELDQNGDYFRVVRSANTRLLARSGEVHKMEDWHRIGQNLPLIAEEHIFERDFEIALSEAYLTGAIGFPDKGSDSLIWKSRALRFDFDEDGNSVESGDGQLTIGHDEISFGGLLRKWRVPLAAVLEVEMVNGLIVFTLSGERVPVGFAVDEVDLEVELESGDRKLKLNAEALLQRLKSELRPTD
jgi:serine/threonine protein kinase